MDAFTQGYMVCALWSSTDGSTPQGGEPLDKNYNVSDIAEPSVHKMEADCQQFQTENADLLNAFYEETGFDADHAGHDFWLNRNGHGSGFWDENASKEVTKGLSDAARAFREQDIYIGDDGMLYVTGGETENPDRPFSELDQQRLKGIGVKGKLLRKANPMAHKVSLILTALESGPKTTGQISNALGLGPHDTTAWPVLQGLKDQGIIKQHKMRWHLVAHIVHGLAITGRVPKQSRELSVPERHQLRIAIDSMNMNPAMLGVMGGPNVDEARKIIKQLTGKEFEQLPKSMQSPSWRRTGSIPASMRPQHATAHRHNWEPSNYQTCSQCGGRCETCTKCPGVYRCTDAKHEGDRVFRSNPNSQGAPPKTSATFHKFIPTEAAPGARVRVADLSGIDSGKTGVILDWNDPATREVRVSYPFVGGRSPQSMGWVAIKLDDGTVTTMPDDRIGAIEEQETAMPQQASTKTAGNPTGRGLPPQKDKHPWKDRLRHVYDNDFEQFSGYCDSYAIAERLGFASAEEAWQANPMISGSVYPEDLRVVDSTEVVASAIKFAMSRKDYILIANVLRTALEQVGNKDAGNGVLLVATKMVEALKRDNSMFNSDHFMAVVSGKKKLESRPSRQTPKTYEHVPKSGPHEGKPMRVTIPENEPREASSDIKPRLAGAKLGGQVTPELIRQAQELIDADADVIYDVAADTGQIVGNVKHMSWFVRNVAEWLAEDPSYYEEFKRDHATAMAEAMHDEPGLHEPPVVI